jgi:hypothetical protein
MGLAVTKNLSALQKALLIGIIIDGLLVGLGLIVFPTTLQEPGSWLGLTADMAILTVYATVGWFLSPVTHRSDPRILQVAVPLGGLVGVIFLLEMILEYIILPENNTAFGFIEFGAAFSVYFLAALLVCRQTGQIKAGIVASLWTSVIGSILWLGGVLAIAYLFHGTPQQAQVFQAEGNYEDFLRSGQTDFDAFIMQDFMGAGLFHLLLGPMIAGFWGVGGGITGKAIGWPARRLKLGNGRGEPLGGSQR